MHQINENTVDVPAPEGMEVIEANAICTPKNGGESFTVKLRIEFPEGKGAAALETVQEMASDESMEQITFELAARGDESCQQALLKIFEENTGEKVGWEKMVEMLTAGSEALAENEGK